MSYRRAEGVLSEILEGRAMLVAPDGTELITLNATGTAVWDALGDLGDPSAIARRLHESRPASSSTCSKRTCGRSSPSSKHRPSSSRSDVERRQLRAELRCAPLEMMRGTLAAERRVGGVAEIPDR